MENLYKISKGQLITVWVFAFIGLLFVLEPVDHGEVWATALIVLIPFLTVFYTIGWRQRHNDEWVSMMSKVASNKRLFWRVLFVVIVGSAIISLLNFGLFYFLG